jgi:hypothetical protein
MWSFIYHQLQRQDTEISKQIFPEKEYRGLSPNFHIHASVSDLFITTIGLAILLEEICRTILVIYKSLTDTWMWKLGLRLRYSQKRNTLVGFPLQCPLNWIIFNLRLFSTDLIVWNWTVPAKLSRKQILRMWDISVKARRPSFHFMIWKNWEWTWEQQPSWGFLCCIKLKSLCVNTNFLMFAILTYR